MKFTVTVTYPANCPLGDDLCDLLEETAEKLGGIYDGCGVGGGVADFYFFLPTEEKAEEFEKAARKASKGIPVEVDVYENDEEDF